MRPLRIARPPAAFWKRWPLIRHVRYLYLSWCFHRWWMDVGRHYWLAPNELDERFLEDVWNGKA